MHNGKTVIKSIDKLFFVAAGIYIVLAAIYLVVVNYYLGLLAEPVFLFNRIFLTHVIIAAAALIFPLLLVIRKKIKLAVILGVVGLGMTAIAFFLTKEIPRGFILSRILPFVLFIPYVWYFIKLHKKQ